MAAISRRSRRAPMPSRASSSRCSSTRSWASSDRNIFSTESRSFARDWKITFAESFSAYRWAATPATPITRKPTKTTSTIFSRSWRQRGQLRHGRPRRRRRHAELSEHILSRRRDRASIAQSRSCAGIRRVADAYGSWRRGGGGGRLRELPALAGGGVKHER